MRSLATRILLGLCLLGSLQAGAQLPEPVAAVLRAQAVPLNSVSVYAQRVDQSEPLLSHQADQARNPASVMKLLTTYAGLSQLGPAYRWRTEFYHDGTLEGGVLQGNLYVKGYGDPGLMAPDLWRILSELRQSGLQEIRGDLVLDSSYFAVNNGDPGSFDGEPYRAYNAAPSALLLNLKSNSFRFQAVAQQVGISVEPALPEIRVINQLKLVSGDCGDWKSRLAYKIAPIGNAVALTFSGSFATDCGEKYLDLSLFDDTSYNGNLFRLIWQQLGGSLQGKVREAATPPQAIKVFEQSSEALADIVRRINKYSNNLMAKQLLLTLGAEQGAMPASAADGDKAIRSWLAGKGMSFPELVIENGAGLSRNERISARHLGQLLLDAYVSPVMPELMSSLPVLAVDGTTAHRLQGSAAQGRAHLKTGSLNGVRAMAGYLLDQKGRRWVLVFIANHANAGATHDAQDALLDWLYRQN